MTPPAIDLNARTMRLADAVCDRAVEIGVEIHAVGGARVVDCGARAELGGLEAGLLLARICLADLADVSLSSASAELPLPSVCVRTDHPAAACMAAQYAGWKIAVGDFFAMGSGPMRAIAGKEEFLANEGLSQQSDCAVGVLETAQLPTTDVVDYLSHACDVPPQRLTLLVARTASIAGSLQVVARSVETALHKLHELGFPLSAVASAAGSAPYPPIAGDDFTALGWTNDAILYGARVQLWVRCDDETIEAIGPNAPSAASRDYGRPFAEVFEAAGRDFYQIDPALFSPAAITFFNLASGRTHCFGAPAPDVLRRSFGLSC